MILFLKLIGILGGVNTDSSHATDSNKSPSEKDSSNKANETSISSKANIENMGLAVFSGDKLVGELTGMDTICHQIVSRKLNICNIDIPSPFEEGHLVSLRLRLCSSENDVKLTDNGPYITCKSKLEGRILSMNADSKYWEEDNLKLIKEYANSYMKSHISDYLYKVSKDFNSDIDGFGRYAVRHFKTWDDWIKYNWLGNFNTSFFDVDVDIDVKSGYILMET